MCYQVAFGGVRFFCIYSNLRIYQKSRENFPNGVARRDDRRGDPGVSSLTLLNPRLMSATPPGVKRMLVRVYPGGMKSRHGLGFNLPASQLLP